MFIFSEHLTKTKSSHVLDILNHMEYDSKTKTYTTYKYAILVNAWYQSITKSKSLSSPYIRSYNVDPKKYNTSEPVWIYDSNENLRLVLSDFTIPYRDGWFVEQLNGQVTLEFEVLSDNPDVEYIQNDGRVVVKNVDGEFAEFIIRIVEDLDGSDGPYKRVEAEGGEYELIDEWITGYKADNTTLRTSLTTIVSGTRWTMGQVDDFGYASVTLLHMTVKEAIYHLITIFGGEVRYRVETYGNQITKRYIDVVKRRGVLTGKRFEAGKDILSTSRTVDTSGIKTALHGRGASRENDLPRITFADVVWVKANGDPVDKPLGQTWVGDPEALQLWGYEQGSRHRWGFYDGQEEDPGQLLLNTWNDLQSQKKANETYEFDVILLEQILGYDHEKVRLGDIVFAVNKKVFPTIEVESSIVEYRQNLNNLQDSKVTLGSFRRVFDISGRFNQVEKIVNDRTGNWDGKATPDYVDEEVENKFQIAITEAQERIDIAKVELEQAIADLETGGIDIAEAQRLINDTLANPGNYTGDFVGDIIADSLLVRGPITSQNATITGTILASLATFMSATMQSAKIIDATIQNATITGRLNGVTGTFVGDLMTSRDAFVGDNLTIGLNTGGSNYKGLMFGNGGPSISRAAYTQSLNVEAPAGLYIYNEVTTNQAMSVGGMLTVGGVIYGEFAPKTAWESGRCGVGGMEVGNTLKNNPIAGMIVSFYRERMYAPSSISLYSSSHSAIMGAFAIDISSKGFWFYITGNGSQTYGYWRGTYDTGGGVG